VSRWEYDFVIAIYAGRLYSPVGMRFPNPLEEHYNQRVIKIDSILALVTQPKILVFTPS
jgi:hypothetical protein